ncbi:MAG: DUF6382 domain-containing protein [Vallitaleaceae bacterium]|jgi:hypothetical protein|nr:DUF6382 domain-containing protein [Vallitaleaceae bacterium]
MNNTCEITNNMHDSYVIINIYEEDMIDYQYRMLRKFQIPHILRLSSISDQNKHMLYYAINSKDSLAYCLKEHTFIYALINQLVNSLVTALAELHEYLLEEERLDLRPEYIFYDRLVKEFYFMYKPTNQSVLPIQKQCFELFDYLIQHVSPSDYKAISLAHRLRIAIENERLNIEDIKLILADVSHEIIEDHGVRQQGNEQLGSGQQEVKQQGIKHKGIELHEVIKKQKPMVSPGWFKKRKKHMG